MKEMVIGEKVEERWFEKRRGMVVGMMKERNEKGKIVLMKIIERVRKKIGWRK